MRSIERVVERSNDRVSRLGDLLNLMTLPDGISHKDVANFKGGVIYFKKLLK